MTNARLVSDLAEIDALRPVWTALACSGASTPFQSFVWNRNWLAHLGATARPYVLLWPNEDLLAPLALVRVGPLRILRILATPESDYVDVLTSLDREEAWRRVAAALAERRRDWDLLHLHSVRNADVVGKALDQGLDSTGIRRVYEVCPVVETRESWEGFLADKKRKRLRTGVNRWRRRLEERGELLLDSRAPPLDEGLVEELAAVERASWKWEHGNPKLRDPARRAFIRSLLADPESPLRLWTLRLGGGLSAFALVLVGHDRWYHYWTDHREEDLHSGAYLLAQIVRAACEGDSLELDLLRGAHSYKKAWSSGEHTVEELAWASGLAGRLGYWALRARWRAAASPRLHRLRGLLLGVGDRRS